MPIWILRPYKGGGESELDYEKEKLYFSYEAVHEYALEVAFDLESRGSPANWCEIWEFDEESDGSMVAAWIYRPVSGVEMMRWPVVIQG